jgi:hypothetical protein
VWPLADAHTFGGIGPVTAQILIAELPETGELTRLRLMALRGRAGQSHPGIEQIPP